MLRNSNSRPLKGPFDGLPVKGWPALPVIAVAVFCWAVLAWPWLSGRVSIPWDAKAHFLPQIQFLAQSLAVGDSPAWAPYVFSGHPQIADPQAMIFSPPFYLLSLFDGSPDPWAADATVFLVILAGMAGLLVWWRDQGWHPGGGLIAALAFGFGAAMAWRIQHIGQVFSLAYLAIAMMFLHRALARGSAAAGVGAGIVAGFMVLGRDQVALLGVYFLIGYVIWETLGGERGPIGQVRKSFLPLIAGAVAGAVIVSVPVILTALVAEASNRPAFDLVSAGRGSLHPALALTFLAPDMFGSSGRMEDYWGPPSFAWNDTGLFIAQNMGQLYIGAIPALLFLMGLWGGIYFRREITFFAAAAVFMVLYALGWYTPAFSVFHAVLPGVDLYRRPADAVFVIGFVTAILAGYAAHRLLGHEPHELSRLAVWGTGLTVSAAFLVALLLAARFGRLETAALPILTASAIVIASVGALSAALWLNPIRPVAASVLLVGALVADLAWSNGPGGATALPAQHYDVLRPDTQNETIVTLKSLTAAGQSQTRRDRVELAGLGFHWPNASLTHKLENTLGYNPVRLGAYSRATGAGDTIGLPDQRKFSPLFPSYRSRLADMLGLRYIASGIEIEKIDPTLQAGDLTLLARTPDAFIYENPRAMPRVIFAASGQRSDFEAILDSGRWPEFDPARTVLLEDGDAPLVDMPATSEAGRAHIVSYANTRVVIEAESSNGGYVVLNDIWHPWWRVSANGVSADMLRANVLFRAIKVGPGKQRVEFSFEPLAGAIAQLFGGARTQSKTVKPAKGPGE